MGHLADALKKAEQERGRTRHAGMSRESTPTLTLAPPSADRLRDAVHWTPIARGSMESPVLPLGGSILNEVVVPLRSAGPPCRPAWTIHPSVVAYHDRTSSITEQFRAVRTWLLAHAAPGQSTCLAITSSVPGEGKSVTTANLAVAMAEVRQMRVLAVDCDFRQGGLGRLLRTTPGPGLADVIAGRAALREAIRSTPLDNFFVLPAGTCGDIGPAELLNCTEAARVFEEIRDSYDCALVDTPPVQQVSDVGVIGGLCTGVVMVVRMNRTDSQVVRQSLRWLQSNNVKVLGCIAAACSLKASLNSYRPTDDIE